MLQFHYCSYWRRWSRVLSDSHPDAHWRIVEVNLTPISLAEKQTWQKHVAPIRIRAHATARGTDDKLVPELPANIRAMMVRNLGEKLTERLLTEDFLAQIDWELFRQLDNGGANLQYIQRR